MALDYDTYENKLYAAADNGYGNRMACISLNGTVNPEIVHILPAPRAKSSKQPCSDTASAAKPNAFTLLFYFQTKTKKLRRNPELFFGSPCWTRTNDISVNSRTLYRLS